MAFTIHKGQFFVLLGGEGGICFSPNFSSLFDILNGFQFRTHRITHHFIFICI